MWLPAAVYRLLSNPIYRGLFVYRNSTTYHAGKAEAGQDAEEPITYTRPNLAIVSDDVWLGCNGGKVSRSGYGGGRHLLAGLVTCGCCQAVMTVSSPSHGTRTLNCASCNQEKMVGIRSITPGYVSVTGVEYLLKSLVIKGLGHDVQEAFQARLQERIAGGQAGELALARDALSRVERQCKRLASTLSQIADDDPFLLAEYQKARHARLDAEQLVRRLEDGLSRKNVQVAETQLAVNPEEIVHLLFSETTVPVERKRAVLSRLFSRIVMLGKGAAGESLFEIDMIPGAIAAELTQTNVLVNEIVHYHVALSTSARRPTVWRLEYQSDNNQTQNEDVPEMINS